MKTRGPTDCPHRRCRSVRNGFTLIDVLVSITVIVILISILIPHLGQVHEASRRVVCQSNVRQIGIGLMTFANEHHGFLPESVFLSPGPGRPVASPQEMDTLRISPSLQAMTGRKWDGLGVLFASEYINTPKVFYCPSHRGVKPFSKYASRFGGDAGEILSNYHYRGEGPMGHGPNHPTTRSLDLIDPLQSSLIADGMELQSDYNHRIGANFFRADLSIHWYSDPGSVIVTLLPETKDQAPLYFNYVPMLWSRLDASANNAN